MKPLRIVHTVSSLSPGGMERFALRIAAVQQGLGHAVLVVALRGGELELAAQDLGVPTQVLQGPGSVRRLLECISSIRRFRPDIINAHNPSSLHYAAFGRRFAGGHLIMTDHAATRGVVRVPAPWERRLTEAVVCVSGDTARRISDHGINRNVMVIHNGVDFRPAKHSRHEVRANLGLGDGAVGIMPAKLDAVKGHDVLIDALALVRDNGTECCVLVVGVGEELDRIQSRIASHGLTEEHIRLLGYREDVPDLLGAVDFLTLPSRMEGLPLSVLEGMSAGLPVIVTPVGGVPELVTSGKHGLIVPVDDARQLAAAIIQMVSNKPLAHRMGAAGKDHVLTNFTFEGMVQKYEKVYRALPDGVPELLFSPDGSVHR